MPAAPRAPSPPRTRRSHKGSSSSPQVVLTDYRQTKQSMETHLAMAIQRAKKAKIAARAAQKYAEKMAAEQEKADAELAAAQGSFLRWPKPARRPPPTPPKVLKPRQPPATDKRRAPRRRAAAPE